MAIPVLFAAALVMGLCFACVAAKPRSGEASMGEGDPELVAVLARIREEQRLPALAMAVIRGDGIRKAAVVGVRKAGTRVQATLADSWHLGSDTKAMTATLIAALVDRGKIAWSTTMEEAFPDFASAMHPDFRNATVAHLLSHRAGLPPNVDYRRYAKLGGVREQRAALARDVLSDKPRNLPGSVNEYSNVGYIVAGAVAEKVTGKDWESALREYVFDPLGMSSAGFGGLGTPGSIDQPWGHRKPGKPVPANGPEVDNPPVLGPAGRVHCTIQDWALFIGDQLRGARGEAGILSAESYRSLATPPFGGDYALGWGVYERSWAGGRTLNHNGSNTMNYATVWIAPEKDFAILACCNLGEAAGAALDEAVSAAIAEIVPRLEP